MLLAFVFASGQGSDLRRTHTPDHVLVEGGGELAVTEDFIAENLGSDLLNRILREEREGLSHGVGGDAVAFETNVLHLDDVIGGLESNVLAGIELLLLRLLGLVDEVLGQRVCWASGGLGGWPYDDGRRGRLVEEDSRHCVELRKG